MALLSASFRWILAFALALVTAPGLAAQAVRASEYQVKAVFLYNFAQFVDWPSEAFPDSTAPFVIGILGDDPFGDFLDETVRGERLQGRSFEVRHFQTPGEIKTCHILFISRPDDLVQGILGRLGSRPILTVSDEVGFAERGGMVRLVNDRNHIRLQINLEAVQAANLMISSKLLRVAEIAKPRAR